MPIPLNSNQQLIRIRSGPKSAHFCSRVSIFKLGRDRFLLLNAVSGAVDLISCQEKQVLFQPKNEEARQKLGVANYFRQRGYFFLSQLQEDRIFASAGTSPPGTTGLSFHIFVGSQCNFACPYCFEKKMNRSNQSMSPETVGPIFRAISLVARKLKVPAHKIAIKIFGGEPLLPAHRRTIAQILQLNDKTGYTCTITTNGYFLNDYWDLFEKHKKHIRFFHISLDGPPAIHNRSRILKAGGNTFRKIADNIDQALERGFRVLLRTNFTNRTLPSLPELIKYYEKMKWHQEPNLMLQFSPIFDMWESRKRGTGYDPFFLYRQVRPLLQHIKKRFCWPAVSNFFGWYMGTYLSNLFKIDLYYREIGTSHSYQPQLFACPANTLRDLQFFPDGKIYPCSLTAGLANFAIGRFLPKLRFYGARCRQWRRRNILSIKPCKDCAVSGFCGGGCVVSAVAKGGGFKRADCADYSQALKTYIAKYRGAILKYAKSQF